MIVPPITTLFHLRQQNSKTGMPPRCCRPDITDNVKMHSTSAKRMTQSTDVSIQFVQITKQEKEIEDENDHHKTGSRVYIHTRRHNILKLTLITKQRKLAMHWVYFLIISSDYPKQLFYTSDFELDFLGLNT